MRAGGDVPRTPGRIDVSGVAAQPAKIGISRAANSAPMRWVVQRPQPSFGPANPIATPQQGERARGSR